MKKRNIVVIAALSVLLWGCSSLTGGKKAPAPVSAMQAPESVQTVVMRESENADVNTVRAFFWDVELRYMVEGQLKVVIQALRDMSQLSAEELQEKRYADFYGEPKAWTLQQVLGAYFVPAEDVSLEHFYRDIDKAGSRDIIRQTLKDIEAYLSTGEQAITENASGW